MKPGKFFVIDGADGSGKATQTARLIERLRAEGLPIETVSFPQYGKKSAGPVEEYLAGAYGTAEEVGAKRASVLFAADRYAAGRRIREWLASGKNVVADRYVASNMGHQGGKIADPKERMEFFRWNDELEYGLFGIPKPDLNIILHLPAEKARQRVEARGRADDIHERDIEHLRSAAAAYLDIARLFPGFALVDCMDGGKELPVDEIHERVWRLIAATLAI